MSLAWFRLYGETVDDAKLKLLAFEDRWHYVAVLCCKAQGILDNTKAELLDRTVAVKLGLALRELDEVRRRLMEVELIHQDWQPTGWERRQYTSDDSSARVRKFREKQSSKSEEKNTETDSDTDTERVVTATLQVTLHETLPISEWNEWISHRKSRRWPCDPTTLKKQLNLLSRHDCETQRQMLDNSMQAGWKGLFEPKNGQARKSRYDELMGQRKPAEIPSAAAQFLLETKP
jgi:hypothetical protein